jgi:hypothetical protein
MDDEEVHSEEAASAANEAQLPTGDTTEDESWLNEDEDVGGARAFFWVVYYPVCNLTG